MLGSYSYIYVWFFLRFNMINVGEEFSMYIKVEVYVTNEVIEFASS